MILDFMNGFVNGLVFVFFMMNILFELNVDWLDVGNEEEWIVYEDI